MTAPRGRRRKPVAHQSNPAIMRHLMILCLLAFQCARVCASDHPPRSDLSALAATAKQQGLPILLIVSQHHCPFCERLQEEIIRPMEISEDYEDRVIIAEILIDSVVDIPGFDGDLVRPGALAEAYRVWVTPTLLFVDHAGTEVHRRMLGVNTIEMYGYYLDESLAAALKAVRVGDRSYVPTEQDILGDAPGVDQRR